MEQFGILSVLKILGDFGTVGLVIFLWWSDNKRMWSVLEQYKKDMNEQREMYKNNVKLCKDFSDVTSDLRDIVTLNIQTMTECKDSVNNNQFCPVIRISKKKAMRFVEEEG